MSLGKGNWVLFIWGKYREGAKGDDRGTLAGSRGTSEPSDRGEVSLSSPPSLVSY